MKNFLIGYNILILLILFVLTVKGVILSTINPTYNYIIRVVLLTAIIVLAFYFPKLDMLFSHPVRKKLTTKFNYVRLENPFLVGFYFGLGFFLSLVIVYFLLMILHLVD